MIFYKYNLYLVMSTNLICDAAGPINSTGDEASSKLNKLKHYSKNGVLIGGVGLWYYKSRYFEEVGRAIALLSERLDALLVNEETNGACVSLRLECNGQSLGLVIVYCRPSEGIDRLLRKIVDIVRLNAGEEVIIGGDFNTRSRLGGTIREGSWNTREVD